MPVRRRLRRDRRHRHGAPGARSPSGDCVGREERHRHQFGAAHLAPAQLPARARRRAAGLVDHLRGRQPHGPWRRVRVCRPGGDLCRARGAIGVRERRRARLRHRRDGRDGRVRNTKTSNRCNGRVRPGLPSPARMFADGGFFTPDGKARFVEVSARNGGADRAGLPADAQHRPRARPVAHHDAHGKEPAPVAAQRRALRRDQSA